mmetsp:Transcript_28746/g.68601  ORF Transcript_28746/g.68601 Transcript_28746/m.68601 type:complete len:306 (-) Transcript_28746:623-1540(-)
MTAAPAAVAAVLRCFLAGGCFPGCPDPRRPRFRCFCRWLAMCCLVRPEPLASMSSRIRDGTALSSPRAFTASENLASSAGVHSNLAFLAAGLGFASGSAALSAADSSRDSELAPDDAAARESSGFTSSRLSMSDHVLFGTAPIEKMLLMASFAPCISKPVRLSSTEDEPGDGLFRNDTSSTEPGWPLSPGHTYSQSRGSRLRSSRLRKSSLALSVPRSSLKSSSVQQDTWLVYDMEPCLCRLYCQRFSRWSRCLCMGSGITATAPRLSTSCLAAALESSMATTTGGMPSSSNSFSPSKAECGAVV